MRARSLLTKKNLRILIESIDSFVVVSFLAVVILRWIPWDHVSPWIAAFCVFLPWIQAAAIYRHGSDLPIGSCIAIPGVPIVLSIRSNWDGTWVFDIQREIGAFGWAVIALVAVIYVWTFIRATKVSVKNTTKWRGVRWAIFVGIALPFGLLYAGSIMRLVNVYADQSVPVYYSVTARSHRFASSPKAGTSYFVTVDAWGPRSEQNEMEISEEIYGEISPGDSIRIGVCEGAIRWPWICSLWPMKRPELDQFVRVRGAHFEAAALLPAVLFAAMFGYRALKSSRDRVITQEEFIG